MTRSSDHIIKVKNLLNSIKKQGKKPGSQLIKNPLNSIRKQGEKLIIFIKDEKPPKPNKKNKKENIILIEDRDKISQRF